MAEARVVIDLIHGEENEDVNRNAHQPRPTFTSEEKVLLSRIHAFHCPIMMDLIVDPVVTKDGQTYGHGALTRWTSASNTNPMTREVMANDALYRNIALQNAMEEVARNMVETERRLKTSDDMEKKMTKAMQLMRTMLDAETAKVKKLENDMAKLAQTMTNERENNDVKWALLVDETKKKSEMEKATLISEYQTQLDREQAGFEKAVAENRKIVNEKKVIQKKLQMAKNDLKMKHERMEAIAEMLKHDLEKEPTNRKSNKKARH